MSGYGYGICRCPLAWGCKEQATGRDGLCDECRAEQDPARTNRALDICACGHFAYAHEKDGRWYSGECLARGDKSLDAKRTCKNLPGLHAARKRRSIIVTLTTMRAQVDAELEKHLVNGLIETWTRTGRSRTSWAVRMSNSQLIVLPGIQQASLFCWGLESAHQAHREQDHDVDGQQWAYECGRAGMGPDEFRRQRGIRDKHGAAKLAESLLGQS